MKFTPLTYISLILRPHLPIYNTCYALTYLYITQAPPSLTYISHQQGPSCVLRLWIPVVLCTCRRNTRPPWYPTGWWPWHTRYTGREPRRLCSSSRPRNSCSLLRLVQHGILWMNKSNALWDLIREGNYGQWLVTFRQCWLIFNHIAMSCIA